MIVIKHLKFNYNMELYFSSYIKNHYFSLKCIPLSNARQRILRADVSIEPVEMRTEDTDSFGNRLILGHILTPHTSLKINLSGEAVSGIDCYEEISDGEEYIFRYPSEAVYIGDNLRAYHEQIISNAPPDVYNRVLYFMHCIHRDFSYCPGATSISTTAENAAGLRRGVCQDYAHVMIALCRMEGIAARYVVGMMTGEGLSHAWAEVKCKKYWYGFDPTNNYLVDENYIKISHGRDFFDCIVNKGIYHNPAVEVQKISVSVEQIGKKHGAEQ